MRAFYFNPAGSFDVGAQMWGMGELIEALPSFGLDVSVDIDTARQGWQRMEEDYARYCGEHPAPDPLLDNPFHSAG